MTVLASTRAEEKFAQIQSWPHWPEIALVAQKEYGVSQEEFQALLLEYQRFMTLIASGYKGLGMHSESVDKIWHSHMLYSKLYRDFCITYVGHFVDHKPNLNLIDFSGPREQCEAPPTPPPDKCIPEPPPDTPPVKCGVACDYDDDPRDQHISFEQAYREAFHISPPAVWSR